MNYCFAQPSKILKPFVKQYWALEKAFKPGEQYTQRIIPSGLPELILYLDHKPKPLSKNRSFEDHFLISGQQNDFYDIHISRNLSLFSVLFHSQGLSQFLAVPMDELLNHNVPLKYLNKSLSAELEARLSARDPFHRKVEIMEDCLVKSISNKRKIYETGRIGNIMEIIRKTEGMIHVEQLASYACLGKKQFERTFSSTVGMTPKRFLKTIRMQAAIYRKSKAESMSLTELAYASGYYDQSHFINDFKAMTGYTPKQFFLECEATRSDFFED